MENKTNYVLVTNNQALKGLSLSAARKLQAQRGGYILTVSEFMNSMKRGSGPVRIGDLIEFQLGEHLGSERGYGEVVEITERDVVILSQGKTRRIYFDEIVKE